MTLQELYTKLITSLTPALGANEAKATARLLLEDDLKATTKTVLLHGDRVLEPETVERFESYIRRITAGEPPQYVVGQAQFMGLNLKVTPAVLIPRPETAQLVDMITDRYGQTTDLQVIDLGTGSGCIILALGRALPFPKLEAVDISDAALDVARENAQTLGVKVDFHKDDILAGLKDISGPFDIIVSNPPYIADKEKASMDARVKDYEPSSALFVPDSDPLEFYRAIADWAKGTLKPSGTLYFEINPIYADELKLMMTKRGFSCDLRLDSYGKTRFAVCTLA